MTQQTPAIFSDKGLASYGEASEDYELAPIGIASMPEQVKRLAEFGRNGDIYVIHAAEGETVIPMEVLDANPQIKALLFNQMEEMGLDPERYIIGNELNSINPVTGMPEFFSFNPFKAVKKVVKKVVNIAKKYAPVILPIAAAAFGIPFLGPMFPALFGPASIGAAALSSGIGTLVAGGNMKDAFKSALISGGTAGIMGGFKGMKAAAPGTSKWDAFVGGVKTPNPEYVAKIAAQKAATENLATLASAPTVSDYRANVASAPIAHADPSVVSSVPTAPSVSMDTSLLATPEVSLVGGGVKYPALDSFSLGTGMPPSTVVGGPSINVGTDWAIPGADSTAALSTADVGKFTAQLAEINKGLHPYQQISLEGAIDKGLIKADTGPWLGKASPSEFIKGYTDILGEPSNIKDLALIGGGLYAGGAFEPVPEEDPEEVQQAALDALDPIVIDPEAAQLAQIDVTTQIPTTTAAQLLQPSIFTAAQGGAVNYPRREALVEGPGTTTSDDIPAMLSDGEFVINSKAVQGADPSGRGNRYAGAQNLYNMMRNFEMRA